MITLGVDAHKGVHVAVALNGAGQEVARWRGRNSPKGWQALGAWAAELAGERQWGIEGAWNYGRGLAQHLVAVGEAVHEVNPRWTAAGRRRARSRVSATPWMLTPWRCSSGARLARCRGWLRKTRRPCWTCW